MRGLLRAYLRDETGSAAAEYAMILTIIGTSIGAALFAFGNTLNGVFTNFSQCLKNTSTC